MTIVNGIQKTDHISSTQMSFLCYMTFGPMHDHSTNTSWYVDAKEHKL